jgi:hypothetical protein
LLILERDIGDSIDAKLVKRRLMNNGLLKKPEN